MASGEASFQKFVGSPCLAVLCVSIGVVHLLPLEAGVEPKVRSFSRPQVFRDSVCC